MHTFIINVQRRLESRWPVVVEHTANGVFLPVRDEGVFEPPPDTGPDLEAFKNRLAALPSPKEYGTLLGQAVFQGAVRDAFLEALTRSEGRLHVLVFVEEPELQSLHWERLCAPLDKHWDFLALDRRVPFSLYLPSLIDWRFRPIGRLDLKALVLVASPEDPEGKWRLAPFDVGRTVAAVRAALGKIPCDVLARAEGAIGRPTLDALCDRIVGGPYTLLHLVSHGRQQAQGGETILYLATDDNRVAPVNGTSLLDRLGRLRGKRGLPHFAFLAACETATAETAGTLGSLAQRLVRDLGMPAVLAMSDQVSVTTAQALTEGFYGRLWEHGEVDLALSEACAGLAGKHDVNVPVLYSRLEGRALFSESLTDRALTPAEINQGVSQAAALLGRRAPVLLEPFERQAAALRASADESGGPPTAAVKEAGEQALATLNRLCERALDQTFIAVALGKPPLPYDDRCPFRGLYAFRPSDREFFFGREALVDRLRSRLADSNFLAVLGPSGSGKSSLVLAGLVPALLAERKGLTWAYLTPGDDPVQILGASLAVNKDASLFVVDQFEELFTLCPDEGKRRAFLAELLKLQRDRWVVLTMRADFWGECAPYRELAALMQARQELVAPLDADELRRAMEKQALHVGLRFEADLSTTILEEVQGEPGAMPLLQHALLELWKRRHGRWLQAEEYRAIGGVRKAIAQTAEAVYRDLPPGDQERVRDVFLRLTKVGDERDNRQRVLLSELTPAGQNAAETHRLVKRLADEGVRLLVSGVSAATGREEVEVAHEALIQYWPRLREWLDQRRDLLRIRQAVSQAARDWDQNRRDRTFLLHRARRLEAAQALRANAILPLTKLELDYLDACRKADILNMVLAYGGAGLLLALIVGLVAVSWYDTSKERDRLGEIASIKSKAADDAQEAAEKQRQLTLTSRRREYAANCNLMQIHRERANLVPLIDLLKSTRPSTDNPDDLRGFEWYQLWRVAHNHLLELPSGRSAGVAFGPGPSSVLTASRGNQLVRWDGRTAALVYQQEGHKQGVLQGIASMAFCPKTGEVATGGNGDSAIKIWDAGSGKLLRTLPLTNKVGWRRNVAYSLQFSENGDALAMILEPDQRSPADGFGTLMGINVTAAVLDPKTGDVRHKTSINAWYAARASVALTRDGTQLAVGQGRTITLVPLGPKQEAKSIQLTRDYATALAYSPDGKLLAVGRDGITLWDLEKNQQRTFFDARQKTVLALAFSPDGKLLASGGEDRTVQVWDVELLRSAGTIIGHLGAVSSVAFSPDSRRLASGSADGVTKIWDVGQAVARWQTNGSACAFSGDGSTMVTWDDPWLAGRHVDNGAASVVKLVDTASWTEYASGRFPIGVEEAFLTPDGTGLVVRQLGSVHVLRTQTLKKTATVQGALAVYHPPTGGLVVLGETGGIQIVSVATGEVTRPENPASLSKPVAACFLAGKNALAVADGQRLAVLDCQSWRLDREIPAPGGIAKLRPSPNGKLLLVVGPGGRAALWDVEEWRELRVIGEDKRYTSWDAFAFAPGGDLLAAVGSDQRVTVLELPGLRRRTVLLGHVSPVTSLDFSPNGSRLVTGSTDQTVRLWDVSTGQHLLSLETDIGRILTVRFSPDGRAVISTHWQDDYRRVRVWEGAPDDEVAAASLAPDAKAAFDRAVGRILSQPDATPLAARPTAASAEERLAECYVGRRLLREAFEYADQGTVSTAEARVRAAGVLNPDWSNRVDALVRRIQGWAREHNRALVEQGMKLANSSKRADWERAKVLLDDLLARDPGFAGAYFFRGLAQYKLGNEESAVNDWLLTAKLEQGGDYFAVPHSLATDALYNLACVSSVRASKANDGQQRKDLLDKAFAYLEQAIKAGFKQKNVIERDEDLAPVRRDPRYRELLRLLSP
jgi:WD40 repeat protein